MATIKVQGKLEKQKGIYYVVDPDQQPLGIGGMGKVLAATSVNERTGEQRPVAIKFLFEDLPLKALENARREASIQLRNDNLIEMFGFSETEDRLPDGSIIKHYHVASELLHGVSLSDVMKGNCKGKNGETIEFAEKLYNDFRSDSVHFAKNIVINILSGLMALHDAGYVHRDIDPSNIMITDDEHIKLIDFGIAKQVANLSTFDDSIASDGGFIGKPEYAAPELARSETRRQNQATDIYAVGILLYQCILGHVPFEGELEAVLEKQKNSKIDLSPIADKGMRKIISVATAKKQEERYQTAAQMRVAFETLDRPQSESVIQILSSKMSDFSLPELPSMQKISLSPILKKPLLAKRNMIIVASVVAVSVVGGIIGVSMNKAAKERVNNEVAEQHRLDSMNNAIQKAEEERLKDELQKVAAENAKTDSLLTNIMEMISYADQQYAYGSHHGEGYENHLINAYKNYNDAKSAISNIEIDADSLTEGLDEKIANTRNALNRAIQEFNTKAYNFKVEDMLDVAAEFYTRVKNIQNVLQ